MKGTITSIRVPQREMLDRFDRRAAAAGQRRSGYLAGILADLDRRLSELESAE
ncbi:MAG: hypothetical protein ACKVWR_12415 [Acidimicrobiales bacterium]